MAPPPSSPLASPGFLIYLKFYSKGDAHNYWRGVDRGDIDKPMFEIGMKGVEGGQRGKEEE